MKTLTFIWIIMSWLVFSQGCFAQTLDISAGGMPTVTGANGATITANSGTTQDLTVVIDLGDVSPMNSANLVKVTIPVAVRSTVPYQVNLSANGSFASNPRALQVSDIGFGLTNLHSMGAGAAQCTQSSHQFRVPFGSDPADNITFDSNGRAAYTSSIADVGVESVLLSGPRLSSDENNLQRSTDNGYIFDAIFVIKPQFYASGNFTLNLVLTISDGPHVPC